RMRPRIPAVAILSLSLVIPTAGCAQVHLAKTPIATVRASLPNGPGIAPGENSPLVLTFAQPNSTVLLTRRKGRATVHWQDSSIHDTVAGVGGKGVQRGPADPRNSEGKVAHVAVAVPGHPGVETDLDIPIRSNYAFTANFYGVNGAPGNRRRKWD